MPKIHIGKTASGLLGIAQLIVALAPLVKAAAAAVKTKPQPKVTRRS